MKRLIVDGYNVIRLVSPYRELADRDDMEGARAALIADVSAFAVGEWDATVVFDGAGNAASTGEPHDALGVTVIFSPAGVDADTVIESIARRSREQGERIEVVTSDAQTQWAVMGGLVTRRSSGEFADELGRDGASWQDHAPSGRTASRLEHRIPADIRATLERWARGEA